MLDLPYAVQSDGELAAFFDIRKSGLSLLEMPQCVDED
ncbi:hypothetical protein B4110_3196 [Parageobacillus toebii]|uniref:Uncharacterized protein n=1 Tax=Parageobacillus toebii TaxID=153151 RepID=A0A150MGM9_9BACL|nr:hypothetical protein B4110_3196 [Parageobacillus toebii]